ncbi:MAG: S-methyl-5-thioribose-1-phosphate isomerase, partial [archaeon]
MEVNGKHYQTVWFEKPVVRMINQPLLPHSFEIIDLPFYRDSALAIKNMVVRGAGAIGATAGFAMAQGILEASETNFESDVQEAAEYIRSMRPTAQNLFYAVDKVLNSIENFKDNPVKARETAVITAQSIALEDASY